MRRLRKMRKLHRFRVSAVIGYCHKQGQEEGHNDSEEASCSTDFPINCILYRKRDCEDNC